MYAQVSRVQIHPDRVDDWIALTRNSILPAAARVKGFVRAYVLFDRDTSSGMGVSLWETEADVTAVADSGFYQEQAAKAAPYLAGPPEREVYEVVLET